MMLMPIGANVVSCLLENIYSLFALLLIPAGF
ncbi:putative membrane protein, partial [Bacteroides fragilis str. 3397 T10]